MSLNPLRVSVSALAIAFMPLTKSAAHEIVGNRFFPATLGIDDPGVNDELSVPTVSSFKTGDDPSFRQLDFSAEFSQAHHRSVRNFARHNLLASGCARWPDRVRSERVSKPGDHFQIPGVQEPRA